MCCLALRLFMEGVVALWLFIKWHVVLGRLTLRLIRHRAIIGIKRRLNPVATQREFRIFGVSMAVERVEPLLHARTNI